MLRRSNSNVERRILNKLILIGKSVFNENDRHKLRIIRRWIQIIQWEKW